MTMSRETNEESKYLIGSVNNAMKILEAIGNHKSRSLKQLIEELGLPKTSVYRILLTLEKNDFIYKDDISQNYKLGEKILYLASSFLVDNSLKDVAREPMERLFAKYGDTVNLGILSNKDIIYIDILESQFALRMQDNIGSKGPAHATALGKAILSTMSDSFIDEFLNDVNFIKYTDNTLVTKEETKAELEKIAAQGHSFDNEELVEGARCIAAPVIGANGRCVGAVSISGPLHRFHDERLNEIETDVKATVEDISKKMGYFGGKNRE